MKKKLILINMLLLIGFCLSLQAIIISPSGTHYVGDTLTFRPTSSFFSSATSTTWTFGDGSSYTSTVPTASVTHVYTAPGTYTVQATGNMGGSTPIIETTTVQILPSAENRYITVDPASPIAGQPATFHAYNFNTPDSIVWDMGDGTILRQSGSRSSSAAGIRQGTGGMIPGAGERMILNSDLNSQVTGTNVVTHTYSAPGNYTVRAYDYGGDSQPITKNITVRLPARGITYSPAQPFAGAPVQFNAVNFLSTQIDWNFGDGTTVSGGSVTATHIFNTAGTFTVTAKETNSNYNPVSVRVTVTMPNRRINLTPRSPRVDQEIYFQALNFLTTTIDWNFGDGTITTGAGTTITHRYQAAGTYTISAKDSTINHTPVTITVSVAPENRYIMVSPPEVRTNETVTVTAFNFRGDYILWDFGDGTVRSGLQTETYQYRRAGTYIISAQDENGNSQKKFTAQVIVRGIDDQVNLQLAEITLDNGKHYKIVPKNSKSIRAVLRMKMRGTGIVSGFWAVDGHPFEFFSEAVNQGVVKEVYTRSIPGLPTIEPGIHTITMTLTRPGNLPVVFPILKYFVLPTENIIETLSPPDGFVAKEKEIPEFSWREPKGASKYQVAFSNYLYPFIGENFDASWIDVGVALKYTPTEETWNAIKRNRWTYWKVRAVDTNNNVVAESDIMDIKVVIATAEITINKVTDLEGKDIALNDSGTLNCTADDILVHGSIEYKADSPYLVLRVYVDDELRDQLLFRDVKKDEKRYFETAVPNKKKKSQVQFKVLRVSSPAVIVGITGLILKR